MIYKIQKRKEILKNPYQGYPCLILCLISFLSIPMILMNLKWYNIKWEIIIPIFFFGIFMLLLTLDSLKIISYEWIDCEEYKIERKRKKER